MDALAVAWLIPKALLLLAGLVIPGALLMRTLRVPMTVATSFAGSALSIYATVLALQWLGVRIALGSIAGGLLLITVSAALVARLGRGGTDHDPISRVSLLSRAGLQESFGGFGVWTLIYALFWIAVVWRAWHEPL